MRTRRWLLVVPVLLATPTIANPVFEAGFEQHNGFNLLSGCKVMQEGARSGQGALYCPRGSASLVTPQLVTEPGMLEFWVKPENAFTNYRINILSASSLKADANWQQVGLIEMSGQSSDYLAHRVSIDDPGRKFIRLDIESANGGITLDDVSLERIGLDVALSKNEQKIVSGILDRLKQNQNPQLQAEQFKTLGQNYATQLETQRQYLEYANAIYASVTLVMASSERNKMSNPLAYTSFRAIVGDTKRVSSPLQQARLSSMVKPFGDLATATLTVVSAGTYAAFAEPFKSFLAAAFDKSNYDNADLSRKDRKFAEENGLKIYEKAEKFLTELEKELAQVSVLDNELLQLQKQVDSYRKDLDRQLRLYLQHGGIARSQENFSRAMSKEDSIRRLLREQVAAHVAGQAQNWYDREQNTELVQYLLKTSEQLDSVQEYKERFNQITAAALTFYDRFERSIAPEQNPFSEAADKTAWENHAKKARQLLKDSREAFVKAYL